MSFPRSVLGQGCSSDLASHMELSLIFVWQAFVAGSHGESGARVISTRPPMPWWIQHQHLLCLPFFLVCPSLALVPAPPRSEIATGTSPWQISQGLPSTVCSQQVLNTSIPRRNTGLWGHHPLQGCFCLLENRHVDSIP